MRLWPALDVRTDSPDLALAFLDDFAPTAIEERDQTLRAFFIDAAARDAARASLVSRFAVSSVDVPDEDWTRRSQENLTPVTVGRIRILPNPRAKSNHKAPITRRTNPESRTPNPVVITISPSMGFGTGHHATTRLCLAALQGVDLNDKFVLDVGTGSGILAIAAVALGAGRALGIDTDRDAIQSALDNLDLNAAVNAGRLRFEVADLSSARLEPGDIVTANLTGALILRSAAVLAGAVRSGGSLILSGILREERDEVVRAFPTFSLVSHDEEDGWVGLLMKKA